jgi:uncharacterized membrane protein
VPPVHPAFVHFPVALVTLSVLADLLGYISGSTSLRAAAWWALAGGAIGAVLTVPAGLFDMNRETIEHDAHQRVHTHMKVGFALFTAIAALTIWRWYIYSQGRDGPGWGYLITAVLVLALTHFQGWLGGELVYSDDVGVAATGQGTETAKAAKARSSTPGRGATGGHGQGH